MRPSTLFQGAGVAALILFPAYNYMIDSQSNLRMHTPVPVSTFALSIILNLVLVTLVFALMGTWLQRSKQWTWVKLLFPGLVFASVVEMLYITRIGHKSATLWIAFLTIVISLTILLHWRWKRGEKLLLQFSGATLAGLGFFCLFVVAQLLYLATWRPLPNSTGGVSTPTTSSIDHPRIVWILFDELSYDQVFGRRYPNLKLPNFDKFRQTSTVFTDVQPVVNKTEKAVPSILLGRRVEKVRYTSDNHLDIGLANGRLHGFDAAQTPFAQARHNGMSTGIVAWYNPYCSMLAPYLSECYWTDKLVEPIVLSTGSFWRSFLYPWEHYGRIFISGTHQKSLGYRVSVYQDLMQRANLMLRPSGPDVVFIHLPLPHPPGFYNRRTQQFDTSGKRSYIDNLALADKSLGQLLAALKQSPRWKNTSVVICGDHSWRVYMWENMPYWTAEDQAASHGAVFDPRPMLMVHLAAQTTAATVNAPFPLLGVHTILDNLVAGK